MATYRDAGVDIEAGEETVRRIGPIVRETFTPAVLTEIGSFGGLFRFDHAEMEEPVLVSSVDGVGTKLKVAFRAERYDTVGQDLVNHCVNDIAVTGARPLFFLDYFATGRLEPGVATKVVEGFATACKENGCALIGGETAEMPDMYQAGEFDLAGTVVGVVDKAQILDGRGVKAGDLLVGVDGNGLHTNGYTLARTVLFDHFDVADAPEELGGRTVGEELLRVHRSYLELIQQVHEKGLIEAAAHITGGGLVGNVPRVLPEGLSIEIDYASWKRPPVFDLIQQLGEVPEEDMRRTFNLGIGLVFVAAAENADALLAHLGEEGRVIGKVVKSS